ncbi:MAG: aconitase X catalytic domain-containing protein [Acidobacteria bacterium]|nr:aconitase X catalytic domain-containing protein [Acidobacteriota bacterium]
MSSRDRAMLSGELGPAPALAMSIVSRMAAIVRAPRLIDISHAHIDSSIYVGDAGLEFAERLAGLGARVVVPSSLNVSGVDEHHWQEWPVAPEWAGKAHRQMVAYRAMGCSETWTCAPYQTQARPVFGQQIAWGESNAIVFANSVIGARTERYPDLFDICAAITGRVPDVGLHTDAGRLGHILITLDHVPAHLQERDEFYPVLGFLLGRLADDKIPVVDGLTVRPTDDQLKSLGATAASSGSVALFHLVGITPEAATVTEAFGGRSPEATHRVGMAELREARRHLTTNADAPVDLVLLGSPHFSVDEFRQLAPLLRGRRKADSVEFLVTTSRIMRTLAADSGMLRDLEAFGGRLTVDTCVLATPMLPSSIQTIMTNSGKYAYYVPGLLSRQVVYGSLEDCVESAVRGRVVRDDSAWSPS